MKSGYRKTVIGLIPDEWKVQNLAEISQKITDGDHATPKRTTQGYYLLSARNIQNGKIDTRDVDYVGLSEYQRMKLRCNPEAGDILISCSGSIGRVAVVPAGLECVLVRSAALAKIDSRLADGIFIQFWLQGHTAQRQIASSVNQGAQPNLFLNHIERLECPQPPLHEQQAIAQALSDVDALISALDRLIAKKRDIKQAMMQQLLTSKTRLPGFSGKWETKRLRDMADIIKGNTLSKSLLSESGVNPCILYGELFTTYGRVIDKTVSFTNSPEGIKSVSGDVLLPGSTTTTGADLATASALLLDGVALGGDINIVRKKGVGYDPAFLACYLTHVARNEIAELAQGTTIHHLYGKDLKGLSLSLPHHTEQSAIAAVLSDMDAELSALEARRDKTRNLKQGMMQELLTGNTRLI